MSVSIRVGGLVLESFADGWQVGAIKVRGDEARDPGTEYVGGYTYHSRLDQAVRAIVDRSMRDSDATTLQALLAVGRDTQLAITQAIESARESRSAGPGEASP